MNAERMPGTGTDAWFKELQNRLDRAGARLGDAAVQAGRSMRTSAEIHQHLSLVQELIAKIEHRLESLISEANGHVEAPMGASDATIRDVPGFPGYRVDSAGLVWGSRRAGRGYGLTREWRALKPYLVRPGPTPTVSLYRDRVRHPLRVDAVVMLAFVGSCHNGFEVAHLNGDPLDNRLENLRYVPSQQVLDSMVNAALSISKKDGAV